MYLSAQPTPTRRHRPTPPRTRRVPTTSPPSPTGPYHHATLPGGTPPPHPAPDGRGVGQSSTVFDRPVFCPPVRHCPVIDGGIAVRFKPERGFSGVDWQVQTVGPGRPCLECLGTYDQGDVSTEEAGMLDDPSYIKGLPADHRLKGNENVFPFSANLASLEVLHLVALVTGAAGITDFGVQRFRYNPGILEQLPAATCEPWCDRDQLVGQGDRHFSLVGPDIAAERLREERRVLAGCMSVVAE